MTDENLVAKLSQDACVLWPNFKQALGARKVTLALLFLGLTIAIGSTGLLMGALTTALASYMMSRGMDMVPAMNVGFFTVGSISLVCGLGLLLATAKKLLKGLPTLDEMTK